MEERLRARRPAGHAPQALELGPRREERPGGGTGARPRASRRSAGGPASSSRVASVPAREQEERGRKVPRVRREERREERGVEEEAGPGREAPGDRREGEEERQRHRVRVEVPEPEREEGPLGDRVRDAPRGGPEVDGRERPSRRGAGARRRTSPRRRGGAPRATAGAAPSPAEPDDAERRARPRAPRRARRPGCRRTPAGRTRGGTGARGRTCRSGSRGTALPRTTGPRAGAGA